MNIGIRYFYQFNIMATKDKIKFLKDNNCYDKFINNIIKSDWNKNVINEDCAIAYIAQADYDDFINDAFSWYASQESGDYWANINDKLLMYENIY